MTEKGLLYQKGVALRAQHRYKEAGECFRAAADAGDPDACWEMHMILRFGGCCINQSQEESKEYLKKGAALGNEFCQIEMSDNGKGIDPQKLTRKSSLTLYSRVANTPLPSSFAISSIEFQTDAWLNHFYAGYLGQLYGFTKEYVIYTTQAAQLGLADAQVALCFHGIRDFLKEAACQYSLSACRIQMGVIDPKKDSSSEIAQYLHIVSTNGDASLSSLFDKHLEPIYNMNEIRFHLGALIYQHDVIPHQLDTDDPDQFEPEEYRCLSLYLETRQRARATTLAWIICGKRLRVAHDIRRLIGQLILGKEGIVKFIQD